MAEVPPKKMTVDEFFEWQQRQDRNYELVDGVPVLPLKSMTGATDQHDRITVNAIAALHQRLRGKPCRPKTADSRSGLFAARAGPTCWSNAGGPTPIHGGR